MNTKEAYICDISAELEQKYGAPGTPEREQFDEEAYAFYTGQLLSLPQVGMPIIIVKLTSQHISRTTESSLRTNTKS